MGVLFAALYAWSLLGQWQAGRWAPSQLDFCVALGGLIFGVACVIPDVVSFRRHGDAYFKWRRNGTGLTFHSWSWPILLIATALPKYMVPPLTHYQDVLFNGGAWLGLIAWYPYKLIVWKRMQELEQADKESKAALFAAGATPAPRVEG
jgi:hypothetical protein